MSILSGMVRPDAGRDPARRRGRRHPLAEARDRARDRHGLPAHVARPAADRAREPHARRGARASGSTRRRRASGSRDLGGSIGLDVDPDATTGLLALGQQQQLEIIKALWRGSKVLILDEPTSMLTPQGVAELEQILARLKAQGLAVIFITHKLHEAISMGDRVSVLSQGRLVGAIEPEELRSASHERAPGADRRRSCSAAEAQRGGRRRRARQTRSSGTRRAARSTTSRRSSSRTSRSQPRAGRDRRLRRVARACGRARSWASPASTATASASWPRRSRDSGRWPTGDIRLFGHSIARFKVAQREKLGLRYVTDDRLHEGTVGPMSVAMNIVLKQIGKRPYWERGRIRHAAIARRRRGS